jgi:hypothetical protein
MSNISIHLTGKYGLNKQVIISNEDFDKVIGRKLCCLSSGYVIIWNRETNKAEYFHRWLFGLTKGDKVVIDHLDGNKLNCSRENLRCGTISDNMCNRKKLTMNNKSTSKFKGVRSSGNKWESVCQKNKVKYHLGYFETEEEAAKAYNEKAKQLHQHFALLNILPSDNNP